MQLLVVSERVYGVDNDVLPECMALGRYLWAKHGRSYYLDVGEVRRSDMIHQGTYSL